MDLNPKPQLDPLKPRPNLQPQAPQMPQAGRPGAMQSSNTASNVTASNVGMSSNLGSEPHVGSRPQQTAKKEFNSQSYMAAGDQSQRQSERQPSPELSKNLQRPASTPPVSPDVDALKSFELQAKPQIPHQPTADPNALMYTTMPRLFASVRPQDNSAASPAGKSQDKSTPGGNTGNFDGIGPPSGNLTSDLEDLSGHPRPKLRVGVISLIVIVILLLAGGFVYSRYFRQSASEQIAKDQKGGEKNSSDQESKQENKTEQTKDAIPDAWRIKYFGGSVCSDQDLCGEKADPDHDGLTNIEELKANTDPNNPDSEGDGLADGDEVKIFNLDPLNMRTAGIPKYTDSGDLKYKYNSHTHKDFTEAELTKIAENIKVHGLHSPTTRTLSQEILSFYMNYGSQPTQSNPAPGSSQKNGALDRDTQRADAIKQISFALLKYKETNQIFPQDTDFKKMVAKITPALGGRAINTSDPINKAPHIYGYKPLNSGQDFQLSYFSETQNQAVDINSETARKNLTQEQITQRDDKRRGDLQSIANALELYSNDNSNPSNPEQKSFPAQRTWKQAISPKYMTAIPVDPKTNAGYIYNVSSNSQSFTIQVELENRPAGKKGYMCTQDKCGFY